MTSVEILQSLMTLERDSDQKVFRLSTYMYAKSFYLSRAVRYFYESECEIWAGFGPFRAYEFISFCFKKCQHCEIITLCKDSYRKLSLLYASPNVSTVGYTNKDSTLRKLYNLTLVFCLCALNTI